MLSGKQEAGLSQSDELTGLKKLLAALEGGSGHTKTTIVLNKQDVTKIWAESLKWEIKVLEDRLAELKKPHA
jgi:hypothetical protein